MPEVGERLAALQASFESFKEEVKSSFSWLRWILGIAATLIIGSLGGQWFGIASVKTEVRDVAIKVGNLEGKIDAMADKVTSTVSQNFASRLAEASKPIVEGIRQDVQKALVRATVQETPGTLNNVPILKDQELELIKKYIPTAKIVPEADKLDWGDLVRDAAVLSVLASVPDTLLTSVPQLQGLSFAVGEKKILFARTLDNRIVAVVMR